MCVWERAQESENSQLFIFCPQTESPVTSVAGHQGQQSVTDVIQQLLELSEPAENNQSQQPGQQLSMAVGINRDILQVGKAIFYFGFPLSLLASGKPSVCEVEGFTQAKQTINWLSKKYGINWLVSFVLCKTIPKCLSSFKLPDCWVWHCTLTIGEYNVGI